MNVKKNFIELFQYINALGWINGIQIFSKVKVHATGRLMVKGVVHPITLRSHTSDINAFRQVFIYKEYNFAVTSDPQFIIDGGSNVGLAAVYFANRFPNATIASIEPETENFEQIKKNTSAYPKVNPIQSGIWCNTAFLKIKNVGLGSWGFIVEEQDHEDSETLRALSIGDIMRKFNKTEIDILKLDVEGAEKEIFTTNYRDWLPHTKILVVELHDRMKSGCSKAFFKAIIEYDFTIEQMGENLICYRN